MNCLHALAAAPTPLLHMLTPHGCLPACYRQMRNDLPEAWVRFELSLFTHEPNALLSCTGAGDGRDSGSSHAGHCIPLGGCARDELQPQ